MRDDADANIAGNFIVVVAAGIGILLVSQTCEKMFVA
jgi:hypothetical protein